MPGQSPNLARHLFLDQRARVFYLDWDTFADVNVAILRTEATRDPHNKELLDLIGELSTRSKEFRERWSTHNVRHHGSGFKTFHHANLGIITLAYEGMGLEAEPGLTLTFNDYNAVEKAAQLPSALDLTGLPKGAEPQPGEISYGPELSG